MILEKLKEIMGQRPVQKRDHAVQTKRPPVKREALDRDPCYICGETENWAHSAPKKSTSMTTMLT
jgi:hypothetical protein